MWSTYNIFTNISFHNKYLCHIRIIQQIVIWHCWWCCSKRIFRYALVVRKSRTKIPRGDAGFSAARSDIIAQFTDAWMWSISMKSSPNLLPMLCAYANFMLHLKLRPCFNLHLISNTFFYRFQPRFNCTPSTNWINRYGNAVATIWTGYEARHDISYAFLYIQHEVNSGRFGPSHPHQ